MATLNRFASKEDLLAHLTDIAYQAMLRHGLRQSFLDVQLELWNDIRTSFEPGPQALRSEVALEA